MTARKQVWCTREDLNLHALRRPLLRRLRLPFRHECIVLRWCWLEDSNPPPLAYKASALPDELSQLLNRQKDRGAAPDAEATLLERAAVRRRVQFWTFTMSKSAAPPAPLVKRKPNQCPEHARTRARPRHWQGFWMFCGSSCGPSAPPACSAEGSSPAPVIPVSVSSLVRPNHSFRRTRDTPCKRPRTADRSVDWTVRWRR